jgi:hypothetical protein
MTFQQPLLLLGLLVVLAMVGLYLLAQRRRRQFTLKFTDVALLGRQGWSPRWPAPSSTWRWLATTPA